MTVTDRLAAMMTGAEVKITDRNRYATFEDGRFQVYVTPVEQRTRAMRQHFRVGYYMDKAGTGNWKRTNKKDFLAAMEAETRPVIVD
jgi:hypothetical protein